MELGALHGPSNGSVLTADQQKLCCDLSFKFTIICQKNDGIVARACEKLLLAGMTGAQRAKITKSLTSSKVRSSTERYTQVILDAVSMTEEQRMKTIDLLTAIAACLSVERYARMILATASELRDQELSLT